MYYQVCNNMKYVETFKNIIMKKKFPHSYGATYAAMTQTKYYEITIFARSVGHTNGLNCKYSKSEIHKLICCPRTTRDENGTVQMVKYCIYRYQNQKMNYILRF